MSDRIEITSSVTGESFTPRCDSCGWDAATDAEHSGPDGGGYCPRCGLILPAEIMGRRFEAFSGEGLAELARLLGRLDSGWYVPAVRSRLYHEVVAEHERRREAAAREEAH